MATRYIDSAATGSGNGTSWADAWTSLDAITGLSAGDTVYISGGPSGGLKHYTQATYWVPTSGSAGNPINYRISSEVGHNGVAQFNMVATLNWVGGTVHDVIISGDAGDGERHFRLGTNAAYACNGPNWYNFRFSYVDCGSLPKGQWNFSNCYGIEIDHCYARKTDNNTDSFVAKFFMTSGRSWDDSKFHHNEIHIPRTATTGFGDDGIQGNPDGLSVYNNLFVGYTTEYTGGQHQDGIQWLKGSYLKIYNNDFVDIGNYPIFGNAYAGDFSHFWVYNNIVRLTESALQTSDSPQGIVIGEDGGFFANIGRHVIFDDVIMCNNTVVDYGARLACVLDAPIGSVMTNCVAKNNVTVNSGANSFHASVSASNNVTLSAGEAAGKFSAYTALAESNDMHLDASASSLIGAGAALSDYFPSDKDGVSRGDLWDIGAYQYVSGGPPEPGVPAQPRPTRRAAALLCAGGAF